MKTININSYTHNDWDHDNESDNSECVCNCVNCMNCSHKIGENNLSNRPFMVLLVELLHVIRLNLIFYFNIIWKSTDIFVVMQLLLSFILYYFYGKVPRYAF